MLAVIDVETTGLGRNDRIVEIGVVWLSEDGEVVDEFETLVNPQRDVGPTSIHGVSASMVTAAPTFDEIAGYVGERLEGCVLVAHNLPFDTRMLGQEFGRVAAELNPGAGICTLRATGERLDVACDRLGIEREQDHSAGSDARATALLACATVDLLAAGPVPASVNGAQQSAPIRSLARSAVAGTQRLGPIVIRSRRADLPAKRGNELLYGEALDRVLLDGVVSDEEAAGLRELATDLGLDEVEVGALHVAYLERLIEAVERDGIVTDDEERLVQQIAQELGLENLPLPTATVASNASDSLRAGMSVCFTGEAVTPDGRKIDRSELEALAEAHGLNPVSSVTKKKCDSLVAGDPSSASGKAGNARKWGKPIFSVEEFLRFCDGED